MEILGTVLNLSRNTWDPVMDPPVSNSGILDKFLCQPNLHFLFTLRVTETAFKNVKGHSNEEGTGMLSL